VRSTHLPSSVYGLLFTFRPCFSTATFEGFAAFVVGWLLAQGPRTLTGALQAARCYGLWRRHHAGFYRLLSSARWCCDEVGGVLFRILLPWLPEEIDVAVDDTLCHRSGPQIFGVGMHHDAATGTYGGAGGRRVAFACGHSWVVLSIWVPLPWGEGRGIAVPILFRLYRAKRRCPKAQYSKRTEHAAQMLDVLLGWLPAGRTLNLAGDREYGCQTVIRDLDPRVTFTGALPMNALLLAPTPKRWNGRGRPPTKGTRQPSPRALAGDPRVPWRTVMLRLYGRRVRLLLKTVVVCWDRVTGRRPVRVVLTRDPSGRLGDRAYFSTRTEMTPEMVLQRYARRWTLEVTFAAAKQTLGLEQPRNGSWRRPRGKRRPWDKAGFEERGERGRKAAERTVPLIFVTYGLVVAWYLAHGEPAKDVARARAMRPWDRAKSTPAYTDMLSALRRTLWQARLSRKALPKRLCEKLAGLLPVLVRAA